MRTRRQPALSARRTLTSRILAHAASRPELTARGRYVFGDTADSSVRMERVSQGPAACGEEHHWPSLGSIPLVGTARRGVSAKLRLQSAYLPPAALPPLACRSLVRSVQCGFESRAGVLLIAQAWPEIARLGHYRRLIKSRDTGPRRSPRWPALGESSFSVAVNLQQPQWFENRSRRPEENLVMGCKMPVSPFSWYVRKPDIVRIRSRSDLTLAGST